MFISLVRCMVVGLCILGLVWVVVRTNRCVWLIVLLVIFSYIDFYSVWDVGSIV